MSKGKSKKNRLKASQAAIQDQACQGDSEAIDPAALASVLSVIERIFCG